MIGGTIEIYGGRCGRWHGSTAAAFQTEDDDVALIATHGDEEAAAWCETSEGDIGHVGHVDEGAGWDERGVGGETEVGVGNCGCFAGE